MIIIRKRTETNSVKLDETDCNISGALIGDVNTKLKKIEEDSSLSSNAIVKKIKRLKSTGVIVGTTLLLDLSKIGYTHIANE